MAQMLPESVVLSISAVFSQRFSAGYLPSRSRRSTGVSPPSIEVWSVAPRHGITAMVRPWVFGLIRRWRRRCPRSDRALRKGMTE